MTIDAEFIFVSTPSGGGNSVSNSEDCYKLRSEQYFLVVLSAAIKTRKYLLEPGQRQAGGDNRIAADGPKVP